VQILFTIWAFQLLRLSFDEITPTKKGPYRFAGNDVKRNPDSLLCTITRALLVLSVIGGVAIAMTGRHVNEDLFLSLAAGRDIVQGHLTSPEFRSFTAEGIVWVNQAWLSHLLYYLSFKAFGPLGPVLIKGLLLLGCLWLVFVRCRALGVTIEFSLLGLWAGMLAATPFLGNRPENFGVFFLLLFSRLLTTAALPRSVRLPAIPLVLAVWSNCHGSFMLGLGLLGMKCVLETVRGLFPRLQRPGGDNPRRNAVESWCLLAASLVAVIAGSPFGTENLLMPFRQLGTSQVTAYSRDWLPLWALGNDTMGFLGGGSVYPYLAVLCAFALACVMMLFRKLHEPPSAARDTGAKADVVMEAIIALVTVILGLRFRRMILFSAFSLIPLASWVWQSALTSSVPGGDADSSEPRGPRTSIAACVGAVLLCVMTGFICYRAALFPFLPGNPFRPERSTARELMSFDAYSPLLVEFIEKNKIQGRALSGWEISAYLMLYRPELRQFMDCRDQSLYPERVIRDYFTILGVLQHGRRDPLSLLDEYHVSTVVLTTEPTDFDCAVSLMQTKKWACIYADENSLVLVRADSPLLRKLSASDDGDRLWYPNAETKALSRAYLTHFMLGHIPPSLVSRLKAMAREKPVPNHYGFIASGMDNDRGCFKPETVRYLTNEAARLSATVPRDSRTGRSVSESLERIYEILQANALRCGDAEAERRFALLRRVVQRENEGKRNRYLGKLF
jgi:hypothetical protein